MSNCRIVRFEFSPGVLAERTADAVTSDILDVLFNHTSAVLTDDDRLLTIIGSFPRELILDLLVQMEERGGLESEPMSFAKIFVRLPKESVSSTILK